MVQGVSRWRRRLVAPVSVLSLLLTPAVASGVSSTSEPQEGEIARVAEPNAPRDQAVPLVLGDLDGVAGAIDPAGEQDWYVFTAPEAGIYTVEFFEVASGLEIETRGYSGDTRIADGYLGDGVVNRRVELDISIAGTYHVRAVARYQSQRGTYRVRLLPQYDKGLIWQSNGEPDGARMLAPEVQVGRTNAVSRAIEPVEPEFKVNWADRDYIHFHATTPGLYTVEAFDSTVDLDMTAYDRGGSRVADGISGSGVVEQYVGVPVSIPGDYFVRIQPRRSNHSGTYNVRVLPQYDQGLTWSAAHEPNNTRMTGFTIDSGQWISSALEAPKAGLLHDNDTDWFNVPVAVGKEHIFTFTPDGFDGQMYLYDQAGKRIESDTCWVGNTCEVSTIPSLPGDYHVRIATRYSGSGAYTVCARVAGQTCAAPDDGITRLAGENRYATAAQVARQFPVGADVAYIADGSNFPDALAGAARAGALDAPVLLTQTTNIPAVTRAELSRLKPARIVVLGGTVAVSNKVMSDLRDYATDSGASAVTRVAGDNRFETAARLSAQYGPGVATAYIATGRTYPDALSGAALAASTSSPVLLVDTDKIPASVASELQRLKPQRIVVLGGTSAVSSGVAADLAEFATASNNKVTRLAGGDRYATSAAVAARFPANVSGAYLATGMAFPDALSGAALAGMRNSPVLLSRQDGIPNGVRPELDRLDPKHGYLIGSTGALSDDVRSQLAPYIQ